MLFTKVQNYQIKQNESQQRIDNFLLKTWKDVPKSLIYRKIRKGEVRVNGKRVKPEYRLQVEDQVRIPPLTRSIEAKSFTAPPSSTFKWLYSHILYEDNNLMMIDKPAGLAVHGGTKIHDGLIEMMRALRPDLPFFELVHRLDKGTSGCVLLAKNRESLLELHQLLKERKVKKTYIAIVHGKWDPAIHDCDQPIIKKTSNEAYCVKVGEGGDAARTLFSPLTITDTLSLIESIPLTGRMHQIRAHLVYLGYPIIGDTRYGDFAVNKLYKAKGIHRLCLHADSLMFTLPSTGKQYDLQSHKEHRTYFHKIVAVG